MHTCQVTNLRRHARILARAQLGGGAAVALAIALAIPSTAIAALVSVGGGLQAYDGVGRSADSIDRGRSASAFAACDFAIGDSDFSFGPSLELYSIRLPESGHSTIDALAINLDYYFLGRVDSYPVALAAGAHSGAVYGNGGLDALIGAHARGAYRFWRRAEVFLRLGYGWTTIPYRGDCSAVSPVAGCVWRIATASGYLGLGWGI